MAKHSEKERITTTKYDGKISQTLWSFTSPNLNNVIYLYLLFPHTVPILIASSLNDVFDLICTSTFLGDNTRRGLYA